MKIEVTEMEGSLLQSLRDPGIKVLVNGEYPVKRIYQNMNAIIIESDIRDWHTGTPTDIKGWFLLKYRAYGKFVYRTVENPVIDIFADSELEWQKIEPYKEATE